MEEQEKRTIEELLQENLRLNREIHEICIKLKKYMHTAQILGVIKTLIIIIPIVVSIMILVPLFREALPQLKILMGYSDINSLLK